MNRVCLMSIENARPANLEMSQAEDIYNELNIKLVTLLSKMEHAEIDRSKQREIEVFDGDINRWSQFKVLN